MMRTCINCGCDEFGCGHDMDILPSIPCSSWKSIVAISNDAAVYNISWVPNAELREEGYDQAIEDLEDWWEDVDEDVAPNNPWTTMIYNDIWMKLRDGKKSRFHPEPPKPEKDSYQRCLNNITKWWVNGVWSDSENKMFWTLREFLKDLK